MKGGWSNKGIHYFKQREFEVVYNLSNDFPVALIYKIMGVNRSGFYKWRKRLKDSSNITKKHISDTALFLEYHEKYTTHGYRWLNRLIRNELGLVMSDNYAHRCCKNAEIKSKSSHYKYKKAGNPFDTGNINLTNW